MPDILENAKSATSLRFLRFRNGQGTIAGKPEEAGLFRPVDQPVSRPAAARTATAAAAAILYHPKIARLRVRR
jgi:hypothetical protein